MLGRAWAVWRTIVLLPFYPAIVVHEGLHAAVAWPWADDVELRLSLRERPVALLWYPRGTPAWAIVLANLAPFLVGLAALPLVLWYVRRVGTFTPAAIYAALLWAGLGVPSRADVRPAMVLIRRQVQ